MERPAEVLMAKRLLVVSFHPKSVVSKLLFLLLFFFFILEGLELDRNPVLQTTMRLGSLVPPTPEPRALLSCCFYFLFRATPTAYEGSQARDRIRDIAASLMPQPQQCQIQAASATDTTAHGNAGSLTH